MKMAIGEDVGTSHVSVCLLTFDVVGFYLSEIEVCGNDRVELTSHCQVIAFVCLRPLLPLLEHCHAVDRPHGRAYYGVHHARRQGSPFCLSVFQSNSPLKDPLYFQMSPPPLTTSYIFPNQTAVRSVLTEPSCL